MDSGPVFVPPPRRAQEEAGSSGDKWSDWIPMDPELFQRTQLMRLAMLQKVDELLTAAGVPYWITGGTLIGALRHEGFIPHDDDVDIECYEHDLDKIAAIPTDGEFYVGFQRDGRWEGHHVAKMNFGKGFAVDIFPRSVVSGVRDNGGGPEEDAAGVGVLEELAAFPGQAEVFPLERYMFHNIEVSGPNRKTCTSYLDRLYGKDWSTSVCVWNHDFNWYHSGGFDPRKTVLALNAYNEVVRNAGVADSAAEKTADETFAKFFDGAGNSQEEFYDRLKREDFERTKRRNKAAAEWRAKKEREKRREAGLPSSSDSD